MSKNESVWEYYGGKDPYFGVKTVQEMRGDVLDDHGKESFFAGGEEYVGRIWKEIEENFERPFEPGRSLDFGCGVGRLAIPIARRSGTTVGVDISSGMLDEAQRNADEFGVENVAFVRADDELSRLTGNFDFIHSFVVFQHIPPDKGVPIFRRLVDMLRKDGIGAIQFQYAASKSTSSEKIRYKLYRDLPGAYAVRNLLLRKKQEPLIPMYPYDLNQVMLILQNAGCHKVAVRFSDHSVEGVLVLFKKASDEMY